MSYFSSILNFPISTTDLIPLTAIRTPTSVLSLPNEIILHILQYLHVGESVLFGLTCRRLYALHRRLNSSLISLSTICPNPLACQCLPTEELYFYGQRGFQSMFLPHQQHEVGAVASLDEYGVIRFTDRERAKSPEELELIRRRTELGCYEIPCFTLAEKLKGWMGKGWEFCFACGRFRRVRKWRVDWGFQVSLCCRRLTKLSAL